MSAHGRLYDVTVPLRPGVVSYPGDPLLQLHRVQSIADGEVCNVTEARLGVHTGTHVDAPVHFIDGAGGVDTLPLDALVGPAYVVDATGVRAHLDATALAGLDIPADAERVLFRMNPGRLRHAEFDEGFRALLPDAAAALVQRGMRLVANDYLSVAPFGDPTNVHVALLSAGVVILEGVDLADVAPGRYELVCLPLPIVGCDGAPARVLLRALDA